MCGRTCVGVTGEKRARAHALCTHVLDVISHAHTRVRPYIARVRVRMHLRNSSLAINQVLWGNPCMDGPKVSPWNQISPANSNLTKGLIRIMSWNLLAKLYIPSSINTDNIIWQLKKYCS
jgi:hypothetical protein